MIRPSVLIKIHAVLLRLSLWHVHRLLLLLIADALDEIGQRGRCRLHVIFSVTHTIAFDFASRALIYLFPIRGQALIMRGVIYPIG